MPTTEEIETHTRHNQAFTRIAPNAYLVQSFGQIAGRAMAEYVDWQLIYLDLALSPAALLGGPVTLGYEDAQAEV